MDLEHADHKSVSPLLKPNRMIDLSWDIHEAVRKLGTIPGALEADIAELIHGHDTQDYRRFLRRLEQSLDHLSSELIMVSELNNLEMEPSEQGGMATRMTRESPQGLQDAPQDAIKDHHEHEETVEESPKKKAAVPYFQQTQDSLSTTTPPFARKPPPAGHQGSPGFLQSPTAMSVQNETTTTATLLSSELCGDLLFLFMSLSVPHNDDFVLDLVESCLERISKIWMDYSCSSLRDYSAAAVPLLRRILQGGSYRADLAQIRVLNSLFASINSTSELNDNQEDVEFLIWALHQCLERKLKAKPLVGTELDLENCHLCAWLVGYLVDTFDQHKEDNESDSNVVHWLQARSRGFTTNPSLFVSELLQILHELTYDLTERALDDLNAKEEGCWVISEAVVHLLMSAVCVDGTLMTSADRLWKEIVSYGLQDRKEDGSPPVPQAGGDDYTISYLSVQLAPLLCETDTTRTKSKAFVRGILYPSLLLAQPEPHWWSTTVPKQDLQNAVSLLLREPQDAAKELAYLILRSIPRQPHDPHQPISWDYMFWREMASYGILGGSPSQPPRTDEL